MFAVLQYGGQMFMPFYGRAIDAFGYSTATWVVAFPVAAIGLITAFFVKPSPQPQTQPQ
jgi:hypothetical protein